MEKQGLWFLRSPSGETLGPFPSAMLIRHQLLGRVKRDDPVSVDRFEWKTVQDFPEIDPALAIAPAPAAPEDPFWSAERAKAKLRWAEERETGDRRNETVPTPAQSDLRSGKERRESSATPRTQREPLKLHGDGRRRWVAIIWVVLGCAALVTGLIWLGTVMDPVKPINVKISQ